MLPQIPSDHSPSPSLNLSLSFWGDSSKSPIAPPLAMGAEGKPQEEIFLTFATPADKLTTEKASKLSKAVIPLPYSGETASFSLKKS